jgi:DNA helicase-2/ATP-dependent DNA helicase PcrA
MPPDPSAKGNRGAERDDAWDYDYSGKNNFRQAAGKTQPAAQRPGSSPSKPASIPPRKPVIMPRKPADPSFVSDDPDKIQSGMKVEHNQFGLGKVLQIEGNSPNRKATVFFQDIGEEKQLLLKFAKLRIVTRD